MTFFVFAFLREREILVTKEGRQVTAKEYRASNWLPLPQEPKKKRI